MLEEVCLLNRYDETIESDSSIKLDIKFTKEDFSTLSAIMAKCREDELKTSLEVYCEEDGARLIQDGETVDETIDKIVNKFHGKHDEIREIVAKASFQMRGEKQRLQMLLVDLLAKKGLRFRIQFFIYKYSISEQLHQAYAFPDGCRVYFWLSEAKLIERDMDSFFNVLWSEDYPVFLVPDSKNTRLNFALLVNDLSKIDKNALSESIETRRIFLQIKNNIGIYEEGKKLMVHLALLARDSAGKSFVDKIDAKLELKEINTMPFPESHYLSFKEKWNSEHVKEAAAFANACGGLIVVGVTDKTTSVVGVNFDSRIVDIISQNLNNITPIPSYDVWPVDFDGKKLIFIFIHKENDGRVFRLQKGEQPVKSGSVIRYILNNDEVLRLRRDC